MMDRYDELMLGFYRGDVPAWLPEASREGYARESIRRRCALGQSLLQLWPCTMFVGRAIVSPELAAEVYSAWPAQRGVARNVNTGLYLALEGVLQRADVDALWELFQYESLVVRDLAVPLAIPRADRELVERAGLLGVEIYRFRHRVQEFHARMNLYLSAAAPASFVRDYAVLEEPTFVARRRPRDHWLVDNVTDAIVGSD
jgi:hypothetical protein